MVSRGFRGRDSTLLGAVAHGAGWPRGVATHQKTAGGPEFLSGPPAVGGLVDGR